MNELSGQRKTRRKHNTYVSVAAIACSVGLQSFSSVDVADSDMQFEYANILYKMKKTNDAIEHYKLASQLKPADAYFQERLALILFNEKDYAGSIAAFRKAIQADPKNSARLGSALKLRALSKRLQDKQVYR